MIEAPEDMTRNEPALLISQLPVVFSHNNGKLTDTAWSLVANEGP